MKRFATLIAAAVVAAVLVAISGGDATAKPKYKTEAKEYFKESKAAEKVTKAGCGLCHPVKDRKVRNDFAKGLDKAGLTKDKYKELQKDKEAQRKHFQDVMSKFLESKEGAEFQKRIDAGELPVEFEKE